MKFDRSWSSIRFTPGCCPLPPRCRRPEAEGPPVTRIPSGRAACAEPSLLHGQHGYGRYYRLTLRRSKVDEQGASLSRSLHGLFDALQRAAGGGEDVELLQHSFAIDGHVEDALARGGRCWFSKPEGDFVFAVGHRNAI